MLLAVQLLGPTGRPSRLQSFQPSPPPFGQPARDTTPVQIQQIRDLQNPPSLFVGLDSPEAHVFQYVVCQGPSIERHTQPIEYYPMEVKRNITLIMKRPICASVRLRVSAAAGNQCLDASSWAIHYQRRQHLRHERRNVHKPLLPPRVLNQDLARTCPI